MAGHASLSRQGVAAPYIVTGEASGFTVGVVGRCPDPGSPDGFGEGNESEPTLPVGVVPGPCLQKIRHIYTGEDTLFLFSGDPISVPDWDWRQLSSTRIGAAGLLPFKPALTAHVIV
jgi:hypothetical protein